MFPDTPSNFVATNPTFVFGRSTRLVLTVVLALTIGSNRPSAADPGPLFGTGDAPAKVVMVGDSLIEQAQYSGWIETALATAMPGAPPVVRNLGWNGDTPAGASRGGWSPLQAGKDTAEQRYELLVNRIVDQKPDVLVVGYGTASALGELEAATFEQQLRQLIDDVRARCDARSSVDCPAGADRLAGTTFRRRSGRVGT